MRQPLANQVALHCSGWSFREAVAVISAKVMECGVNPKDHEALAGESQ